MTRRLSNYVQILVGLLFRWGLKLYPPDLKRDLASEMQTVLNLKIKAAALQGSRVLIRTAWHELLDLPKAIITAYYDVIRGRMKIIFPATSDQSPRTTALLSLLPFMIAGPVRIILSYQPGWQPADASYNYFWFLLVSFLLILVGLVLGIVKKFPRWSYPYAFYLAFAFYLLIVYANYLFNWNFRLVNNFFLYILMILVLFWLPPFRTFYRRVSDDWTVLTYGLYALVLFLLSGVDFSETPHSEPAGLNAFVVSFAGCLCPYAHPFRFPAHCCTVRCIICRAAVLVVPGLYRHDIHLDRHRHWPVDDAGIWHQSDPHSAVTAAGTTRHQLLADDQGLSDLTVIFSISTENSRIK